MGTKKKKIRCIYCDKSFFSTNALRKFCNRSCYTKYRRENPASEETLCWTCRNTNGNKCSWFSREMKPVDGWKAKENPTADGMSYFVISCPRYEKLLRGGLQK